MRMCQPFMGMGMAVLRARGIGGLVPMLMMGVVGMPVLMRPEMAMLMLVALAEGKPDAQPHERGG